MPQHIPYVHESSAQKKSLVTGRGFPVDEKHGLNALLALLTEISRRNVFFFLCSKDQIGSAPLQSLKLSLSISHSLGMDGELATSASISLTRLNQYKQSPAGRE